MAVLLAILSLIVAVVVGVWLFTADHLIIGLAVLFGGLPLAFGVWMTVSDRRDF